jgi:hypothetical protein
VEVIPTSSPKDQLPQSERRKRKKIGQKQVSHDVPEETIEFPQESVIEFEKMPKAVIVFPQELISELEETPKMTSGSNGKLKTRKDQKKQISEPTTQSSRVEIGNVQQGKTPEPTIRSSKAKIKSTQEKQVPRPITAIKIKKRKLFEETSTPVSKSEEVSLPV